jgi:citronellol/citronellal dehydrogenase
MTARGPLELDARSPEFGRVVVTGGGSGIGRALALALAAQGATVYAMGRRPEALEGTRSLAGGAPGEVRCVTCDVRDATVVDRAFAEVEEHAGAGAQALFHGAADIYIPSYIETVTPEAFAEVVSSRLIGTFHVLQRWARPLIAEGRPGVAVAVSSSLASREAPGATHSGPATAGVESMVRSMAREWGRHGLRLNVLAPGVFPSDTVAAAADTTEVSAIEETELGRRLLRLTPLGRFGAMPEVVAPAMFLLSPAARFITGDVLVLDGGLRLMDWAVVPRPD